MVYIYILESVNIKAIITENFMIDSFLSATTKTREAMLGDFNKELISSIKICKKNLELYNQVLKLLKSDSKIIIKSNL